MFKLILYNPSWTFWALWKIVSAVYNKKYLERVRIIKKGKEADFWEILDPELTANKYGGSAPDLDDKESYWPPKQLQTDIVTIDTIKEKGLMTFDFLGHHADVAFFKSYTPWEKEVSFGHMQWDTIGKGKLDKVYY